MKTIAVIALVSIALASCANTVRGVGRDAKDTGMAFQDGTNTVLKAGSTKKSY